MILKVINKTGKILFLLNTALKNYTEKIIFIIYVNIKIKNQKILPLVFWIDQDIKKLLKI